MDELAARLDHLQIQSAAPERLAAFYGEALGMRTALLGPELWLCAGPSRRILIGRGEPRTLGFTAFRFDDRAGVPAMRARLQRRGAMPQTSPSPLFRGDALAVRDPDGNAVVFGHDAGSDLPAAGSHPVPHPLGGRLQHIALGTDHPETLLSFYTDLVGCALTDKAVDDHGLAACWFRTDTEHHTIAVFRAGDTAGRNTGSRFDHHAYEVGEWSLIRDWADHFSARGIPLVWGPGRHGPGNNLFIMIRDPDGNMLEFSAELEVIRTGRPVGVWPAAAGTFNKWGSAAVRS